MHASIVDIAACKMHTSTEPQLSTRYGEKNMQYPKYKHHYLAMPYMRIRAASRPAEARLSHWAYSYYVIDRVQPRARDRMRGRAAY